MYVFPEPIGRTATRIRNLPVNLPDSLRELTNRPIDEFAREGSTGVPRLVRWLWDCTSPDDRILVVGYYPEVSYYAERPFAGGMAFFHAPYFTDMGSQQRIVAQRRRERIPVAVVEVARNPLVNRYDHVGEYVQEHFAFTTETDFGGGNPFHVWVHRDSEPGVSEKYPGLPCFKRD